MTINQAIEQLENVMNEEGIDTTKGLPKEFFHFAATLILCDNINLFITRSNQLLLIWRDDEFYGQGWHIPGGCIRMRETIDKRIQKWPKMRSLQRLFMTRTASLPEK